MEREQNFARMSNLELAKTLAHEAGDPARQKRCVEAILEEFSWREKFTVTLSLENFVKMQRCQQLVEAIKYLVLDRWPYDAEGYDESYLLAITQLLHRHAHR